MYVAGREADSLISVNNTLKLALIALHQICNHWLLSAHLPYVKLRSGLCSEPWLVQNITVDPNDPQKFFQDNDNTFNVCPLNASGLLPICAALACLLCSLVS